MTRREMLPNGVRVLVREMRTAPAVALNLWVGSGSADDAEDLAGVSHFVEHMLFRTEDGRVDLAREVQEAGGYLNAQTGCDHTMYYQVVPSGGWERAFEAQAAVLPAPSFSREAVEAERAVIVEEARGAERMPESFVWRRLMETVFLRHPCRRPVVGTEETLATVSADDLRSHFEAHYGGANLIQVIVGDIEADRAVELAREKLSGLPGGLPPSRRSDPEPPQGRLRARRFGGDIARSYVSLAFRIPPVLHEDVPALDMACGLLGLGRSSRLRKRLQVGGGLVSDVSAAIAGFRDHGVLVVRALPASGTPERVIAEIFREAVELPASPPGSDEMRRAVRRLEAAYVLEHEVPEAVAHMLGFFETLGDYRHGDAYLDRLADVTPDDVARVAAAYLTPENAAVVTYLPREHVSGGEDHSEEIERMLEDLPRARAVGARESASAYRAARFRRPLLLGERASHEVAREELPGGGTLILSPSPSLPVVSMAVGFRGGFIDEPDDDGGITYFAERLTTRGTVSRSAGELADEMEGFGSAVATVVDRDGFGHGAAALSRHFGDIAAVLREIVVSPSFPEAQVEAARAEVAAEIGEIMDHPLRRATARLLPLVFPDHPYGRPLRGTPESVAARARDELRSWHRSIASRERLVVAVVGDVTADEARTTIAREFEALGARAPLAHGRRPARAGRGRLESEGAEGGSTVAIGYAAAPADDPDSLVGRFLSRSMSMMGGRLWVALRERGPKAYFAGSSYVSLREGGALLVHAMVAPGREDETTAAAARALAEVAEGGLAPDELARAKRHFIGTHELSMQRGSTRAATYVMAELLGVGYEHVEAVPRLVDAITNDDVVRVARKYLSGEGGFAAVLERGRRP